MPATRSKRKRKAARTAATTTAANAAPPPVADAATVAVATPRIAGLARAAWWLLLLGVLALSAALRMADYGAWQDHRERYFFDDQPVLLNADGYHYLRLARDYRDGRYAAIDELRTTPEHPPRPSPVPLLSWLTAGVSAVTGLSLLWVAVLLPIALALLLAAPVLLLCRQLRIPPFASLVATLIALNCQWFVTRTRLGAYDTDCLIVAFALGAQAAALGFGLCRDRRRYLYLLGAGVNAALFAWWWDQAPEAVALICATPLVISAAWYYRPARREALLAAGCALALLAMVAVAWGGQLAALGRNIAEVLFFGVKGGGGEGGGGFPNVAGDIAELGGFDRAALIRNTTASLPVFMFALAGFACLIIARIKAASTALLVPVLLALSAFYFGQRGLLFWGPPLGLGAGFLLALIAQQTSRFVPHWGAAWVAGGIFISSAVYAIAPAVARETDTSVLSPRITHTLPVIQAIRAHTPPDALLWSPWSLGYPIMFYTGRRVIADGQYMSGERQVYANMPLASDDPVFARNFIRFYAQHGLSGLRRINRLAGSTDAGLRWMRQWFGESPDVAARSLQQLAEAAPAAVADADGFANVEACRAFLFPNNTDAIFLSIYHEQLTSKWFWYGTWDAAKGKGLPPAHLLFHHARREGDMMLASDDFTFDVRKGKNTTFAVNEDTIRLPINKFITHTGETLEETDYGHPGGLHFEWIPSAGFGILMTYEVAESIVNRLFVRHTMNPADFRHAFVQSPAVSLWEVGAATK